MFLTLMWRHWQLVPGLFIILIKWKYNDSLFLVSLLKNEIFHGISSVNVTKSTVSCVFGPIHCRNPWWKTSFFVQCLWCLQYFDLLSAHQRRSETRNAHHNWFLITCSRSVNLKRPGYKTQSCKPWKNFSKIYPWLYLLVDRF